MSKNMLILCCSFILLFGCAKAPQEPNTVTVWHWMTDRDEAFQELALKYEQETGVKVIFELYAPSDVYSKKIIAAAQAGILPDVFGILDKKAIIASFIKGGYVANLTEAFEAEEAVWKQSLFPKALAVNQFKKGNSYGVDEGIYGVPLDVMNIQMLYNKTLLEKTGIARPPQTFAEFLEATAKLKLIGIPGLVSGWGEQWLIDCFASNYAFNIMGEEKVMATYRGEVPYTDPDWIKVFQVFSTLSGRGALIDGVVTKSNKYAEQDFALERAAFAFNGSWCVNVYHDMNPNLEYGVMLPPAINEERPMLIWGGAGSSFVVNERLPSKDKVIAFLKWLTAKEQQTYLAEKTQNLPSNRQALASIPRVLAEFASQMDQTTHPTAWDVNEDVLVAETFDKGLQSLIIGEKTPQQVAEEVQKMKERQLERAAARGNK